MTRSRTAMKWRPVFAAAMLVGCQRPAAPAPSVDATLTAAPHATPAPAAPADVEPAPPEVPAPAGAETAPPVAEPVAAPPVDEQVALAEEKQPAPGAPKTVTFDDLKFDIPPAARFKPEMLTDAVKDLEGKPIRIRGYMLPTFQQSGIKQFILLMNTQCKFGSAKDPVWCNIRVTMDDDQSASFTIRPIELEGVLNFDLMEGPKYDISLYTMNGAKLK